MRKGFLCIHLIVKLPTKVPFNRNIRTSGDVGMFSQILIVAWVIHKLLLSCIVTVLVILSDTVDSSSNVANVAKG